MVTSAGIEPATASHQAPPVRRQFSLGAHLAAHDAPLTFTLNFASLNPSVKVVHNLFLVSSAGIEPAT